MRTWKALVGAVLVVMLVAALATRDFWALQIARSLVCAPESAPSDLILVENFDPRYVLFERAEALERDGLAPRTLVPVEASADPAVANPVAAGIAQVMAGLARIKVWDIMPIRETEPISLNAALQVRDHLTRDGVKSLILVTSGWRSRRSALVYRAVFGETGPRVRCQPVFGSETPERWTNSWHGIQEVVLEFLKLQYYRFYVLPFLHGRS